MFVCTGSWLMCSRLDNWLRKKRIYKNFFWSYKLSLCVVVTAIALQKYADQPNGKTQYLRHLQYYTVSGQVCWHFLMCCYPLEKNCTISINYEINRQEKISMAWLAQWLVCRTSEQVCTVPIQSELKAKWPFSSILTFPLSYYLKCPIRLSPMWT